MIALRRFLTIAAPLALLAVGAAHAAPGASKARGSKSPTAPSTANTPKGTRPSSAPKKKWNSGGSTSGSSNKKWGSNHSDAERLVKAARGQGTDGRACICRDASPHRLGRQWVADVDAYKGGPALAGCRVPSFHPETHTADPGGEASAKECKNYVPLPG
ncbi:MAG: hypothetical protein AAF721_23585 [Myxococcota bacterium]